MVNQLQKESLKLALKCMADTVARRFLSTQDMILLVKYNGDLVFYLTMAQFLLARSAEKQIASFFAFPKLMETGTYNSSIN